MTGQIPFGAVQFTGQSTATAVTTSAAKLTFNNATASATTQDRSGDPAVKPSVANSNLVLNAPGIYEVSVEFSGAAASALQATFQLAKGTTTFGRVTKHTFATTPSVLSLKSIVEITAADIPAAGGVATFSDPSTSTGAGKPAGSFAGAGAGPRTGVELNIYVTGNGSVNMTLTDGIFLAKRIG